MSRSWAVVGLVLLASGSGCTDGKPVDPALTEVSLRIELGSVSLDETTVAVGSSIQLSAALFNAKGDPAETGALNWSSTAPDTASVSASGLVNGLQVGIAQIIASAGTHADTVRVNVAQRVGGDIACAPGGPVVSLPPGGVYTTTADQAVTLCVQGGTDGAEFTYIPFNGSDAADARLNMALAASGVSAVTGPPNPSLRERAVIAVPPLLPDEHFRQRMLVESQMEMTSRLQAVVSQPTPAPRAASLPLVGDLLHLNVESDSEDSCAGNDKDIRTGRVVAITDKAIVVADTANPKGRSRRDVFSDEDYRSFGLAFDTLVWNVDTENFGIPSDIDDNGHVLIFFTRAVNELTSPDNFDSYTGGFFYNRDLFPTTGAGRCEGSNHAEMFYMLVPDPYGEINGHVRTALFVKKHTVAVLAHEFQHLINDSRRLYVNKTPVWEEPWLNEGLSHIAEELAFYRVSGLHSQQNIGSVALSTFTASQAFDQYQADNIDRWHEYLQRPDTATLMGTDELPTRGATWAFLRYAADRRGGDEAAFWQALVENATSSGLDNLQTALGVDARDWMQDWAVSIYTDDAGLTLQDSTRYTQPSWDFRELMSSDGDRFPLYTVGLTPGVERTFDLYGGGTAFVRFAVAAGQQAALRTTVNDLPGPSLLHIAIVRTK